MKKRMLFLTAGMCLFFCACGPAKEDTILSEQDAEEADTKQRTQEDTERQTEEKETEPVVFKQDDFEQEASSEESTGRGTVISDQSFGISLAPFGEVRFVSYAPEGASQDAVFTIEQNGEELMVLEGMKNQDIRVDESFQAVEAVSFPDYNADGFDDILVICRYLPKDGSEEFSEARVYEGSSSGYFELQKELSEQTNSALAEITIESIKGFLGVGAKQQPAAYTGWQQAYIEHIREHTAGNEGFALIYLDGDEVPELVEIGDCEASGCRIVCFSNGEIKETQLDRLYFSYIEKENLLCNSEGLMDMYYDRVYSIQDGELKMRAEGEYGLPESGNMEFDENGDPVYEYYWNSQKVTKEVYEQELRNIYDKSKAKDGYKWDACDSEEIITDKLEKM